MYVYTTEYYFPGIKAFKSTALSEDCTRLSIFIYLVCHGDGHRLLVEKEITPNNHNRGTAVIGNLFIHIDRSEIVMDSEQTFRETLNL